MAEYVDSGFLIGRETSRLISASPTCFRFAKIVSARVERKHVFWIGEGDHHCARRTNAPSHLPHPARTFADMFRTTTFLAVFVALIASAQAALPTASLALITRKIMDARPSEACSEPRLLAQPLQTPLAPLVPALGTRATVHAPQLEQPMILNHADWLTTEQQACGEQDDRGDLRYYLLHLDRDECIDQRMHAKPRLRDRDPRRGERHHHCRSRSPSLNSSTQLASRFTRTRPPATPTRFAPTGQSK